MRLPGFLKAFVGIFARHLLFDTYVDGVEEVISGQKDRKTNQLTIQTFTSSDMSREMAKSRNVGKAVTNCAQVEALQTAATSFNKVPYHLLFGSNSNSAAHWLADQAGMHLVSWWGPFGTPGWHYSAGQ
jgi:hypothetical protein